jgi:hypothetical protein
VLAHHVVDLAHELIFGFLERQSGERQLVTGTVGQRNAIEKVARHRIQTAGRDLVIGDRLARHGIDELGSDAREVASPLRRGWDEPDDAGGRAANARALIAAEIEQLVLDDRAAHGSAELVALQRILHGSEELPGIHCAVAQEIEHRSVDLVGTGTGDDVDHAAAGIAELRREIARLQIEFLHRIRVRERQARVQVGVVMAGAVELEIHLRHSRAVDTGGFLPRIDAAVAADAAGIAAEIHCTGRQIDQPLRAPALQRQLLDAFLIDQLAAGSGACLHQFGLPGHGDPLADLADLQDHVLGRHLVDRQANTVLHIGREAVFLDHQGIQDRPAAAR